MTIHKASIGRLLISGLALSAMTLPSIAFAGSEDRARAAVAAAKAKIETSARAGVTGAAADIQTRARAALEVAQSEIKDDDEDQAFHAAQHATALAELAMATAELQTLTTQRDQLAAR